MSDYLDAPLRSIEQACEDTHRDPLEYLAEPEVLKAMETIIARLTRMGMGADGIEHELEIDQWEN